MLTAIKMMYCVVELKCINDTIIYYCKYYSSTEFFVVMIQYRLETKFIQF